MKTTEQQKKNKKDINENSNPAGDKNKLDNNK
jgi:hypothetical protein